MRRALLAFVCLRSLAAASASDYAGAEACLPCHTANFKAQSASSHARALARSNSTQPGDWAFGAGRQAITFVTRVDGESYREDGLSWYRRLNGLAVTPGQTDAKGVVFRTFDPGARILSCFSCHSTGPVAVNAAEEVVPHEVGVRCEVCHGPAAAHVRNPAQNHLRNPAQMTAAAMNRFCGQCHRTDAEDGRELTDLRDARNAKDEPLRLAASACFLRSNGRLNCTSCHDPHRELEQNASAYDGHCKSCHSNVAHRKPVAGTACVTCHMPAISDGPYLEFANHRIAIYAAGNPLIPVHAGRGR
jgi:hypothetical protein